jgi:hypothetical protein
MANLITVASYKTAVRNRLDDTSFESAKLLQYLNDTNREICNFRLWPFMETSFTGTLDTTHNTYDAPADYQSFINLAINAPDASAEFISYLPYQEFDQRYPDPTAASASRPACWTTFNNSLVFGPGVPDQVYTLTLRYIKAATTVTSDTDVVDVPDSFSELVVLGMYKRALMTNDSFDQAQVVAQDFDILMQSMAERMFTRQSGESAVLRTSRSNLGNGWRDPYSWYQ